MTLPHLLLINAVKIQGQGENTREGRETGREPTDGKQLSKRQVKTVRGANMKNIKLHVQHL